MKRQDYSFETIRRLLWGKENAYLQFLERNREKLFYNYPYPGNPGDDLIRTASEMLLDDLGIQRTGDIMRADICLFAGGCPTMWPDVMGLIETYLNSPAPGRLAIGPSTFEFGLTTWPDLFRRFAGKVAGLFARDWKSYQNICSVNLPENIVTGVSHDPAFYLMATPWHRQQLEHLSEEYVLVALRRDHEMIPGLEEKLLKPILALATKRRARKLTRWARNRSKKRKLTAILRQENSAYSDIRDIDIWSLEKEAYLETIRRASRIYTDRLHLMIVGSMLGKKIHAFTTSYGKLEHVFQTSMKDWANVTFGT